MKRFLFISLALAVALTGTQAAQFQNLNFEAGTLVPIPGDSFNRVHFDQAFPDWRGYIGGIQQTAAFHNADLICCSTIAAWGVPALEGNVSVYLHAALGEDSQPADASIAQTAFVPSDARSLLFRARSDTGVDIVTLGGSLLPIVQLSIGPDYGLYGADVTAWAGQESELRFTAVAPVIGENFWIVDSIQFSTTPVPEPSTFALLAVAGAFGWVYWRRKRR